MRSNLPRMAMRRRIGRWLREMAHRIDPQPPGDRPGAPYLNTRGEQVYRAH